MLKNNGALSNFYGKKGEDMAVKYLKKQKYKILERNFSCKFGEIDIIAKDKDTIVFVEVKLKNSADFGLPRERITPTKLKKIKTTANLYLSMHNLVGFPARFDAVEILYETIEHIKNILS